ncbi:hypothetical protein ACTD5D_40870 [Nocardia takedensis]|uniref:hypothetical protein n=1 Tax=Nocardia takedensis TaxID=259390 RepID=UPI003F764172
MTTAIPPVPPGAKDLRGRATCPGCAADALHIEARLTTQPIGTFSLAGVGTKFAARETVWLVCRACGAQTQGRPDGQGHAAFDPGAMTTPDTAD